MCDFFGLRRKDCQTHSTFSSDTRGRPALFPLQRHSVAWKCWYQRLMLLGDGGSLLNCRRNARWTETTDSCFTNCSTQIPSAPESPLSLCYVTDQERRGEWDCPCAQNLNTCPFVPCGKLTPACVLIAVMTDWIRSNHFDTPCITNYLAVCIKVIQTTVRVRAVAFLGRAMTCFNIPLTSRNADLYTCMLA